MENFYDRQANLKEEKGRTYLEKHFTNWTFSFTEGQYTPYDFTATAQNGRLFVGDVKYYECTDPNDRTYRPLSKYGDFGVDYIKLIHIVKEAKNRKATPVLVGVFSDCVAVWYLNDVEWEKSGTWKECNKTGVNYGDKTYKFMAHLPINNQKGLITTERHHD